MPKRTYVFKLECLNWLAVIEWNRNRPVEQCLYARGRYSVSAYSNLKFQLQLLLLHRRLSMCMGSHYETPSSCSYCAVRLTKLDDMSSDVTCLPHYYSTLSLKTTYSCSMGPGRHESTGSLLQLRLQSVAYKRCFLYAFNSSCFFVKY